MPGVTKEQIQAAREADLFAYLQFHEPGVLKRDGPNYRHKEHDSLVYVTGKRYWYWNSRGRSINALDYLIQIRGYGLVDAVHTLVKLVAFQRCDDVNRSSCQPHTPGDKLHGKCLARAGGAENRHICVFVDAGIKVVEADKGVVVLVHAQQYAVGIAQLKADKRIKAGRSGGKDIAAVPG